jgi:hypothetical protein
MEVMTMLRTIPINNIARTIRPAELFARFCKYAGLAPEMAPTRTGEWNRRVTSYSGEITIISKNTKHWD